MEGLLLKMFLLMDSAERDASDSSNLIETEEVRNTKSAAEIIRLMGILHASEHVKNHLKKGETTIMFYATSLARAMKIQKESDIDVLCFDNALVQQELESPSKDGNPLQLMLNSEIFHHPKRRLIPSIILKLCIVYDCGPKVKERSWALYADYENVPSITLQHLSSVTNTPLPTLNVLTNDEVFCSELIKEFIKSSPPAIACTLIHLWYIKMNVCASCGKISLKMKFCGGCKEYAFCDKECQALFWKSGHKEECDYFK